MLKNADEYARLAEESLKKAETYGNVEWRKHYTARAEIYADLARTAVISGKSFA